MPDLTADEILEFRTTYIRDLYTASPLVTLSHYNRAVRAAFFSDSDLETIHDRVQTDYAEELLGVYDTKYNERLEFGDTEEDAATAATAEKTMAIFRLMRAECRQIMMEDPGFVGSVADNEQRAAVFANWKAAIERDRTFVRTRTSSAFAGLQVVRL